MTDMLEDGKLVCFPGPFLPTPAVIRSFVELKDAFMKALVLAHLDPARPICLEMDTSGFAIAGIISEQQGDALNASASVWAPSGKGHRHPVASWSWSRSPAEWNYAISN